MRKFLDKLLHIEVLTRLTVGLGIILMLWVAYLLFWPVKTLVVYNAPLPIVGSTTLKGGEMVTYHYDYCKYYNTPLSIEKDFVDGIIFKTDPIYYATLEKGCHKQDVSVKIPETLPTGIYKIRINLQVRVNQLRIDNVVIETQEFSVINKVF
ncbi:MAG: hypothetical protein BWY74_00776 [Firmicutes bacterium ADurb.Bin419]|nr:MAG: hypothetical protein BWY74_00776 [Firmicutes bacterium ADurb.Bin419]